MLFVSYTLTKLREKENETKTKFPIIGHLGTL